MPEKIDNNPIFFIGTGRNGSTLISDLVGNHPDLGWVSNYQNRFPEMLGVSLANNFFRNSIINSMGVSDNTNNKINPILRLIPRQSESYNFWNYYSQIDFAKSFMADQKATTEQQQNIRTAVSKVLTYSNKNRFFAKLTGPGRVTFLHSVFPNAQFVLVERNPYHVLESFMKVDYWINGDGLEKPWWKGILSEKDQAYFNENPSGEVLTALQIVNMVQQTKKELAPIPENQKYVIQFENFIQNPENELGSLFSFLSLEKIRNINSQIKKMRIYTPKTTYKYKGNNSIDKIFLNELFLNL